MNHPTKPPAKPDAREIARLMFDLGVDWPKNSADNVANASPDLRKRLSVAIYPEGAALTAELQAANRALAINESAEQKRHRRGSSNDYFAGND